MDEIEKLRALKCRTFGQLKQYEEKKIAQAFSAGSAYSQSCWDNATREMQELKHRFWISCQRESKLAHSDVLVHVANCHDCKSVQ